MSTTELVRSVSIENLVNQRNAVRKYLEEARTALELADTIVKAIDGKNARQHLYAGAASLVCRRGDSHAFSLLESDGIASAMKRFDASVWQHLMAESGMRSLMDATARKDWDKAIEQGEHPELTKPNIEATFSGLHGARGDMFERGVIECFKLLSWSYKTNLPQKFGKRIVITYLTGWHSHEKASQLDDLIRVMSILDGKPEPDHRSGIYALLSSAGLTSYGARAGVVENDYVAIRTFKNGNGHITFKRLDLVARMNMIIAKHYPGALPAPK